MRDWTKTLLPPTATIRSAIERLDSSRCQIVLVVEDGKLIGTITDGDVRRALLRRIPLDENVLAVMNADPRTVPTGTSRAAIMVLMHEYKVRQMPTIDRDGRVVDLFLLDDFVVPSGQDAWVVIMAGGLGSRLRPLTEETPKPMLKVGGKPLIHTIVDALVAQGFRRIFLSVKYLAEQIEAYFGDGERFGARIEYLSENEPRGTAGALSLLPEKPRVPLLVMNADLLTAVHFGQLLDFHRDLGLAATMCVQEYSIQVPYGVVGCDSNRVIRLTEKPRHTFFINAGIYVLSPDSLDMIPPDGRYDMTTLLSHLIADGHGVAAFPLREYWLDIGHPEDLERARTEYESVFG